MWVLRYTLPLFGADPLPPGARQVAKIQGPVEQYLVEVLLEELRKSFPQTSSYLKSSLRECLVEYLREFPWQGPLLADHFRYFPVFLKQRLKDPRLYLIAQKEWLWSFVSITDFGFPPSEPGRIFVNPSWQSLYSPSVIAEVELAAGLTVFYYDEAQKKVRSLQLDAGDAALVDLLQEDRKYTPLQLMAQVLLTEVGGAFSKEAWQKKLLRLHEAGLVLPRG